MSRYTRLFVAFFAFGLINQLYCQVVSGASRQRALIIAVSDYKQNSGFRNLEMPHRDAKALAAEFENLGVDVEIMAFGLEEAGNKPENIPNKYEIETKIDLFTKSGQQGDSLIIVYMGHGVNIQGSAYLCPMNARIDWDKQMIENGIKVDTISEMISNSSASSITFFCDACQDSPFNENETYSAAKEKKADVTAGIGESSKLLSEKLIAAGLNARTVAMFQSCSAGERAHAPKKLGNSVFFHFLIEAIREKKADHNRDGVLTFTELEEYLPLQVSEYARKELNTTQTVSVVKENKGSVPFLAWPNKAAWMPRHAAGIDDDNMVKIGLGGGYNHYQREINVTPTVKLSNGSEVPLRKANGDAFSVEFVLVYSTPKIANESTTAYPFYVSKHKITAELFAAYEGMFPGKVDAMASKLRQAQQIDPDGPVFSVTPDEAIAFAQDLFEKGRLPSHIEWDIAFGKLGKYDHATDPNWEGRNVDDPGFAIGGNALSCERPNNPDVSPYGCYDMASNGKEFTCWDGRYRMFYPHNGRNATIELRGQSWKSSLPLTVAVWQQQQIPDGSFFGTQKPNDAHPEYSFRVVIPAPMN